MTIPQSLCKFIFHANHFTRSFHVKWTTAFSTLGGNDFDKILARYCAEQFKASCNIDLFELRENATGKERITASKNLQRLHEACEKCKRQLSLLSESNVAVDSIIKDQDLNVKITRQKMEDLCQQLFQNMMLIVTKVLDTAKVNKKDIDEIILIGGATRIPKIQCLLKSHFNKDDLTCNINPDEAVAHGAAIQAAILNGERLNGMLVKVQDVVPMAVGIECVLEDETGVFWPIIKKNSNYPTEAGEEFTTYMDNQESGHIYVYQGESKKAAKNHFIGQYIYNGIPPGKRGSQTIKVVMRINKNSTLELEVHCTNTSHTGRASFSVESKSLEVTKTKCKQPQIPGAAL